MHEVESLLFPALILGLVAIVAFREYRRSRRRTAFARGEVLRVVGPLQMRTNVHRSEVEFVDCRGQRVAFHSRNGASRNPWPAGSIVRVLYDPEDPTNAEIEPTARMSFFRVVILSALVLGFVLIVFSKIFGD
jgi:Protein of unknown function (DUF3592)